MSLVERGEFDRVLAFHRGRVNQHERAVLLKPPVPDEGIKLNRSRGITGYEADRIRREALAAGRAEQIVEVLEGKPDPEMPQVALSGRPTIRSIQWHVCKFSNTTFVDLISTRRTAAIVKPRQIGFLLAKMMTLASLPEIGRKFGNKDHTTVLHAIRKLEPVQVYILDRAKPSDEISLWVSTAFQGWDELGFK